MTSSTHGMMDIGRATSFLEQELAKVRSEMEVAL